jgi:prevent-host-death family protein
MGLVCFSNFRLSLALYLIRPIDLVYDLVYNKNVQVNIHQAKTHLSRLLTQVQQGEEIIISNAGKPVARLVPFKKKKEKSQILPGTAKGKIQISPDFEEPLPGSITSLFEE